MVIKINHLLVGDGMPNLYRGFSKKLNAPEQVNIFYHKSRVPRDTSLEMHEAADRWFFEKFGIYARSSSLICTTDFSQANSYGTTYQIVPDSSSPMIYSASVKDFLEHESDLDVLTEEGMRAWLECKCFNLVYNVSEITHDFRGEVMVFCESYRAIQVS